MFDYIKILFGAYKRKLTAKKKRKEDRFTEKGERDREKRETKK